MDGFSNKMDKENGKSIPLLRKDRSSDDVMVLDLENIIEVGGGMGLGVNIKKEELSHNNTTEKNYSNLMSSTGGQFEWDKRCFFSDGMKQLYLIKYFFPFKDRTYLPGIVDRALSCTGIFDFSERTKELLEEPAYFTAPYSSDRRQQRYGLFMKHNLTVLFSKQIRIIF
uniref:Uncharacterized protein n=1 Tax=Heterorhabditis bacteriophora TaxID=37862 RepID=A0A1I7WH54_HETBA